VISTTGPSQAGCEDSYEDQLLTRVLTLSSMEPAAASWRPNETTNDSMSRILWQCDILVSGVCACTAVTDFLPTVAAVAIAILDLLRAAGS
jgi:hypothetical protein